MPAPEPEPPCAVSAPMAAPSDCAQMVRLLVVVPSTSTLTPSFAVSDAPSARMRFTSPETVMRVSFVMLPATTYQPLSSVVWPV